MQIQVRYMIFLGLVTRYTLGDNSLNCTFDNLLFVHFILLTKKVKKKKDVV